MIRYAVIFEKTATGYGAHVPDLPGCVATGKTLDETRDLMRNAIEFHIEGMRLHNYDVPQPTAHAEDIDVRVA